MERNRHGFHLRAHLDGEGEQGKNVHRRYMVSWLRLPNKGDHMIWLNHIPFQSISSKVLQFCLFFIFTPLKGWQTSRKNRSKSNVEIKEPSHTTSPWSRWCFRCNIYALHHGSVQCEEKISSQLVDGYTIIQYDDIIQYDLKCKKR